MTCVIGLNRLHARKVNRTLKIPHQAWIRYDHRGFELHTTLALESGVSHTKPTSFTAFEFGPRFADSCLCGNRQTPITLKLTQRGILMSHLKYGIVALAFALFATPSVADAQNLQQLGTRRGAVTGAILGAIIGDQNNEAFAGAAIGGLVGGTLGNVGGRNLDRQFQGGQPIYNYNGYRGGGYYNQPAVQYRPVYRSAPVYHSAPVYRGHGGYGGGYGHGYRGW